MKRTRTFLTEAYEVLGVTPETPKEEVKRAFKKIIMVHHPDTQGEENKAGYEEASKIYIEAYKAITDEEFLAKVKGFEDGTIGRNQDCYCGSEKKYKQCCGK
jgi:DnaJ-class molecular chaperone